MPQVISINQHYRNSPEYANGVSFKEWIEPLKQEYSDKKLNQQINTDFVNWVGQKIAQIEKAKFMRAKKQEAQQRNASDRAKKISETLDKGKKLMDKVTSDQEGLKQQEATREAALKDNSILGLKPLAFYSIIGVVLLGIGTGIYIYVKRKK